MSARWHARLTGSLKARVSLGAVLALVLGIGITTAALNLRARADTLAAGEQQEVEDAARIARLLSRQVVAQQRALAALAARLPASSLDDPAAVRERLQATPLLALGQFDSLIVAGADGAIRLVQDVNGFRSSSARLGDREYVRQALTEGRPVISPPVISRVNGEPLVALAQPLVDGARPFGVVIGGLSLKTRDMLAGIADVTDGDEGALALVTDSAGRILAHPQPDLVGLPLSAEPRLAGALERWRAAGQPVEPSGLAFSGPDRLVAAAGVAGPDWVVWHSRTRSGVLAPLARAQTEALRWAVGMVVVMSAALLALLGWVLRPLARLQSRAEHLFDGSLDPQAGWPGAGGEIGRLENVLRHVGSERAALELGNRRVIRRLESVMAAAPVGIAFTRDQRFELVSRQFCQLLRRQEADLLGALSQTTYVSNEDYLRLGAEASAAFDAGRVYAGEWQMLRGDGTRVWARLRGQPVDPQDPGAGTIWTANDITHEVAQRSALEWAATHDPLTGLANRAAFDQRVARLFGDGPASRPAAMVVLDLDRFKPINDQHGHAAGDAVLRAVSAAAALRVRASDLLVRLGGDEFAIVLEHCPPDVAARIAEDVRGSIAAVRVPWAGQLLSVGVSVGVAMLTDTLTEPAAWQEAADRACYAAKAAGRGVVHHAGTANLRLVTGRQPLAG